MTVCLISTHKQVDHPAKLVCLESHSLFDVCRRRRRCSRHIPPNSVHSNSSFNYFFPPPLLQYRWAQTHIIIIMRVRTKGTKFIENSSFLFEYNII